MLLLLVTLVNARSYFEFGAKVIPHPAKTEKGGEDAYWANDKLLAVADGVGGWNRKGIDPSLYSRELTKQY
jgi:protein phosphatase PTC7